MPHTRTTLPACTHTTHPTHLFWLDTTAVTQPRPGQGKDRLTLQTPHPTLRTLPAALPPHPPATRPTPPPPPPPRLQGRVVLFNSTLKHCIKHCYTPTLLPASSTFSVFPGTCLGASPSPTILLTAFHALYTAPSDDAPRYPPPGTAHTHTHAHYTPRYAHTRGMFSLLLTTSSARFEHGTCRLA